MKYFAKVNGYLVQLEKLDDETDDKPTVMILGAVSLALGTLALSIMVFCN